MAGYKIIRNDELYHYGIKGMKWGVRRTASQLGRAIKKAGSSLKRSISESNKRADDRKRERELMKMKGKPKKMSSDELKSRIDRLKMEKEYRSLMNETRNRGRKTVGDVMSDIGKNTARNLGTQAGVYTIGKLINKLAGQDVVNPKKGQKDK